MIDVTDSNAVYYYHFDGLGSVAALSDVNSVIVERYEYDVFGRPDRVSDVNNPYFFTGRRYDDETGLYYYRARYYDPYIGRFLQTDTVGYTAGLNLYTYVNNNPLNWLDPFGLIPTRSPSEYRKRRNTVARAKHRVLRSRILTKRERRSIEHKSFRYDNRDDYDYDYDRDQEYGYNIHQTIGLTSLHWDKYNNFDVDEFLDTLFHEIVHELFKDLSHDTKKFKDIVDELKKMFLESEEGKKFLEDVKKHYCAK